MPVLSPAFDAIRAAARQRILILDGAMGTQIQNLRLAEGNYVRAGEPVLADGVTVSGPAAPAPPVDFSNPPAWEATA